MEEDQQTTRITRKYLVRCRIYLCNQF
jgi:hypothetical protein